MTDFKKINEAIKNGDFTLFNTLNEKEQCQAQKLWDQNIWLNYMSQEPTISEDDLFDELFRIIDDSDK